MFTDAKVDYIGTYSDGIESWAADVRVGGNLVAFLGGFKSKADAERAAQYVFAGAKRDWNLIASASKEAIAAGVRAFQAEEKRPELIVMSRSTLRRHLVGVIHEAVRSAQTAEDAKEAG